MTDSWIRSLGVRHPIVQAPMAGAQDEQLAVAVCAAGGLGFLPCGMLDDAQLREQVANLRHSIDTPFGLNFFCHAAPPPQGERVARWLQRVKLYLDAYDIEIDGLEDTRRPFDQQACATLMELQPRVVSFHFGLPPEAMLSHLRNMGCLIWSTATTVEEGRWLEARGVDAVIAQGIEAGGHRGMFLNTDLATQMPTLRLVTALTERLSVPVIATGGIGDAKGVAAALGAGASACQVGTGFLACPEAKISPMHRTSLDDPHRGTAVTNVISGRPARGFITRIMRELGPMAEDIPDFPLPSAGWAALRKNAELVGCDDFSPLWAGTNHLTNSGGDSAGEYVAKLAVGAAS